MIGFWICIAVFAVYCIGWIILGLWERPHPEVDDLGEWQRVELDGDGDE